MKKKIEQILIILFLISIPFLVYFYSSTDSKTILNGKVIDFSATVDEGGVHSYLIVKLDNNKTVTVPYDKASGLNINKRVKVNVKTTKLFGMKKYQIVMWY